MSYPNSDLIQTFEENSSRLYSLAFLLTGDIDRSVQAFQKALDGEEEANPAGARKLIVIAALATIERELRASVKRTLRRAAEETSGNPTWKQHAHIAREEFERAVVAIDAFPRCAMLLTIFEGMSIKLASVLLNANEALTGAAQRIGVTQLMRNLGGDQRPMFSAKAFQSALFMRWLVTTSSE